MREGHQHTEGQADLRSSKETDAGRSVERTVPREPLN